MKLQLLLFVIGLSSIVTKAQFGPQQIISETSLSPNRSIPLDIDNDGYIDILTSSDGLLKWFRNLDGLGDFSDEIIISNDTAYHLTIEFADIDFDGDNDIIYLVNNPKKIVWLENLDGNGNFSEEQIILENQDDPIMYFKLIDINNDNHLDLVIKYQEMFTDRVVWLEQLDGSVTFENENILISGPLHTNIYLPLFVDIDNDGFLDMLSSYEEFKGPAKVVWYRNLGNSIYDEEQEIFQYDFIQSDWTSVFKISYEDINSDNKKDIILTSHNDDTGTFYHWLENLDNQGSFSNLINIPNITGFYRFYDLDNDEDLDILGATRFGDIFYWLENEDGLGNFSERNIISTEIDFIRDTQAADFNDDGLLDIVSASIGDNKLAWYENLLELDVPEYTIKKFKSYPNPTTHELYIDTNVSISSIIVYNSQGRKVLKSDSTVDFSNFSNGIYLVKIIDTNGYTEVHKVIKE